MEFFEQAGWRSGQLWEKENLSVHSVLLLFTIVKEQPETLGVELVGQYQGQSSVHLQC